MTLTVICCWSISVYLFTNDVTMSWSTLHAHLQRQDALWCQLGKNSRGQAGLSGPGSYSPIYKWGYSTYIYIYTHIHMYIYIHIINCFFSLMYEMGCTPKQPLFVGGKNQGQPQKLVEHQVLLSDLFFKAIPRIDLSSTTVLRGVGAARDWWLL